MTRLSLIKRAALLLTCLVLTTSAHAQATLDTPEGIAELMQACVVITAAHDYEAEGQGVEIPWHQATSRVSSFRIPDAPAELSANVFSSASVANSYCDFWLDDVELTTDVFELFMQDRSPLTYDGNDGICFDDTFIIVEATGPDGPAAQATNSQGHITVHNTPKFGTNPCAS